LSEEQVLCLCKLEGCSKFRLLALLLPFLLIGSAATAMVVDVAATAVALVVAAAAAAAAMVVAAAVAS
jgi:hypothetical protein